MVVEKTSLKKIPRGFTLTETLAAFALMAILGACLTPIAWKAYEAANSVVAAHVLSELSAASAGYLADNQQNFWRTRVEYGLDTQFWFGYETRQSKMRPEGQRELDYSRGPLGPYIAKAGGLRPDPSFLKAGKTFKPKYKNGYFAFGYNTLLEGKKMLAVTRPTQTVVFATSAQVNNFQAPASASNPMLEEFYMLYDGERTPGNNGNKTVHFRHNGKAMVAFADGSVDFIALEESLRDNRLSSANVGCLPSKNIDPSFAQNTP